MNYDLNKTVKSSNMALDLDSLALAMSKQQIFLSYIHVETRNTVTPHYQDLRNLKSLRQSNFAVRAYYSDLMTLDKTSSLSNNFKFLTGSPHFTSYSMMFGK